MKASEISTWLEWMIRSRLPAFIIGRRGVGKTSVVNQTAARLKYKVLYTRLALCESVDLRGLPITDTKAGVTRWLTPAEFPKEYCGPLIWFFDEWMQAPTSVQAVAGQALHERRIGEYRLPDSVHIIGASNMHKERSATNRMPAHIADRWKFAQFDEDIDDWCKWAIGANVMTETIAFLRWRDEFLAKDIPNSDVHPSPRSWEGVSDATKVAQQMKIPVTIEERGYAGMVSDGIAAEYMGFLQVYRKLPDPQAMLSNPDNCPIPEEPHVLCALSAVLAKRATDTNMDRVCKIANRMPAEFSVLCVTQATLRDPKLSNTRGYIDWATKHADVLS